MTPPLATVSLPGTVRETSPEKRTFPPRVRDSTPLLRRRSTENVPRPGSAWPPWPVNGRPTARLEAGPPNVYPACFTSRLMSAVVWAVLIGM